MAGSIIARIVAMIDAWGKTPETDGFNVPDSQSWIFIGRTGTGYAYQKHAEGHLLPMVVSSEIDIHAPTYREWAESLEGRPWHEIAKKWEGMKIANNNQGLPAVAE